MKNKDNPTKPEGYRSATAVSSISVLPWEVWSLLTDPSKLSAITGSLVNIPVDMGAEGFIRFKNNDTQTEWKIKTETVKENEFLDLKVEKTDWSNVEADPRIEIEISDKLIITLSGFGLTSMHDATFFNACNWLWVFMHRITENLGGDPEKCLELHTEIVCSKEIEGSPEVIRDLILTPEKAVTWLAEEVSIETREGGKFRLRWERNWGEFALRGTLTRFGADELFINIKENPFDNKKNMTIRFGIIQTNEANTELEISVTGIPFDANSTFAILLVSDLLLQALLSISIVGAEIKKNTEH